METTIAGLDATVHDNAVTFENKNSSVYLRQEDIETLLDADKVVWHNSAVVREDNGCWKNSDYLWIKGQHESGYGGINEEDIRRALDELQSTDDDREQQVSEWVEDNLLNDYDNLVEIHEWDDGLDVKALLVPALGGNDYDSIEQEDGVSIHWIGHDTALTSEHDEKCVQVNLHFDDDFQPE